MMAAGQNNGAVMDPGVSQEGCGAYPMGVHGFEAAAMTAASFAKTST